MRVLLFILVLSLVGPVLAVPSPSNASATGDPVAADVPLSTTDPSAVHPFLPNVRVTDGSSPHDWQVEPTMVLNSSGRIFVGWKETDSSTAAGIRVGFSYSTDDGLSWAPNILMEQAHPDQGCHNSDPWLARGPDDRVHFAYLEYDCGSGINVANTTDGDVWGEVQYLGGAGGLSDKESLVVDPMGRLYLAWDEAGLGNELQVSWSDDGGSTWAPFVNPASSSVLGVIVATSPDGAVYLTWWNLNSDDIMFDWSADGGLTWHPDIRVNTVSGSASGAGWQIPIPAMNVDPRSGDIYIAWPDYRNGNQDIFVARSTDGGRTWPSNVRVSDDSGSTTQYMVDLAIDSAGTVHAAWEDKRNGDWNIFYSNSTDGGQTWATNVRVSSEDTPGSYDRPGDYFSIESGPDDYIYVVWTDGRGEDFDIYYARNPGFPVATIGITTDPVGLRVTVDGVTAPSPVTRNWTLGSTHTIGVSSPIPAGTGARYNWTSWSDSGEISHSILADSDRTITAYFQKQYQAKVAPDPTHLSVRVDNVSYTSSATFWWNESTVHWLEAPSPQYASPDVRSVWVGWSDGGSRAHAVTASAPLTATATFVEEQALRVVTSPSGLSFEVDSVTYVGDATFWYAAGSYHTVSVDTLQSGSPGVRYRFASWSDGGAPAHFVAFTGAMALQASFTAEYYLTVKSPVPGTGGSGWYAAGATAVATATFDVYSSGPGERLVRRGWSGDASGADYASEPIVMDGPKTAVADYRTQFYLDVTSRYGIVSGAGWYDAGSFAYAGVSASEIPLETAIRASFDGWGGDAAGSSPQSDAIMMDGAKVASASWSTEYLVTVESDVGTVEGGGWYEQGATATVQVPPQITQNGQTYDFAGWTGDLSSTQPTLAVTVNHPISVRATWTVAGPLGVSGTVWSLILVVIAIALISAFLVSRRRRGRGD